MIEPVFQIGPAKLIADLLKISVSDYRLALAEAGDYRAHKIKKKSGGYRTLHIPPKKLKQVQGRLLKNFFYTIFKRDLLDPRIHSFLPKRSIITNGLAHTKKDWNHTLRFDLKDAFPSVTPEMIKLALEKIINEEINFFSSAVTGEKNTYKNRHLNDRDNPFSGPPLFPIKKVPWFRKIMSKSDFRAHDISERFINIITTLTTHENSLPQGARTSPFLLNLVISHLRILDKLSFFLTKSGYTNEITVYADDFTISTFKKLGPEIIERMVEIIETAGLKVNSKKTLIFDRRSTSPLITGLRLNSRNVSGSDLYGLRRYGHKLPSSIKNRAEKNGVWRVNYLAPPKKYLKKIRGLINRARYRLDDDQLQNVLSGHINYLKNVYLLSGQRLPQQILKPYNKYLKVLEDTKISEVAKLQQLNKQKSEDDINKEREQILSSQPDKLSSSNPSLIDDLPF